MNTEPQVAKQTTPHGTLLEQLLDPRQPKTEREWAAKREIDELRAKLEALAEPSQAREPLADIMKLADEYATAAVEFAKRIAAGAGSMSPLAVEAGDKRAVLASAIEALAAAAAAARSKT